MPQKKHFWTFSGLLIREPGRRRNRLTEFAAHHTISWSFVGGCQAMLHRSGKSKVTVK
jgi:hypothetical protein